MVAASPELSFTELRDTLEMTDGNLITHMRTLQEAGLRVHRQELPQSTAADHRMLTAAGRRAFANYVALLERIVQQTRPR